MEDRIAALEKRVAALENQLQNGRVGSRAPAAAEHNIDQLRDTMERLSRVKRESLQRANQLEVTEEEQKEVAAPVLEIQERQESPLTTMIQAFREAIGGTAGEAP